MLTAKKGRQLGSAVKGWAADEIGFIASLEVGRTQDVFLSWNTWIHRNSWIRTRCSRRNVNVLWVGSNDWIRSASAYCVGVKAVNWMSRTTCWMRGGPQSRLRVAAAGDRKARRISRGWVVICLTTIELHHIRRGFCSSAALNQKPEGDSRCRCWCWSGGEHDLKASPSDNSGMAKSSVTSTKWVAFQVGKRKDFEV